MKEIAGSSGVLNTPLFIAIHAIMIVLFAVDTVTRSDASAVALLDPIYDWSTLAAIGMLLLAGIRFSDYQKPMLSISLLMASLNILLSMSRSAEPGLILDVLILLSISVLLSLYFTSMVGISHGVITAVIYALYIFRYSDELMWSSRNIVVLVGVYITLIFLVGHYVKRVSEFLMDYRRLQRRNDHLSHELEMNSVQKEMNGLMMRLSQPLYVKTGNAISTLENLRNVLNEMIHDERLTEKQRDLSTELSGSLGWELTGMYHIIRGVNDLSGGDTSGAEGEFCNPVQLARSLWDDMADTWFKRALTAEIRIEGSELWELSPRGVRIMLNGLFRYALSLVEQENPGKSSFQLRFDSDQARCTLYFVMENVSGIPEPWEGSALMLCEYAVRILFSGTLSQEDAESGSRIHIDLPKT